MLRPPIACLGFVDFGDILGNFTACAEVDNLCGITVERNSGQVPELGWMGSQDWVNGISQDNGDRDLVPAYICWLCGDGLNKRRIIPASSFMPKRDTLPALAFNPEKFHVFLYVPSFYLDAFPLLELGTEHLWVRVYAQSLTKDAHVYRQSLSHLDRIPTDFHRQMVWGLLFPELVFHDVEPTVRRRPLITQG